MASETSPSQSVTLRRGVVLTATYSPPARDAHRAPSSAPALVFLHGGLGDRYNFFARRRSQRLNIPVLVISGGEDSMFSKVMGAELAALFPQGEHLHLPEAGHLMIAEYPKIVNEAIASFISRIEKPIVRTPSFQ